ncbi:MAG: hypothetical protein FWC43_04500 [Planctomycetaceae bacterium]|nr:hypothetical protein [Planctomycetaceae bacterium]
MLAQILQSRVSVLEQMLRVSEKQLEVVRLGDMTLLLQLLARKRKVYDTFEELERQLDPYRNIEPQDRKWESEQQRLDSDAAIERSKELLAAILELDQQGEAELLRQKDDVQRQMQKMDTSGKAAAVYAKQNVVPVSPKIMSPHRFDFFTE